MNSGVDLLDFSGEEMYFDRPLSPEVSALIASAAEHYGERADSGPDPAEFALLRAYLLAPEDLNVLVALYRFFYYRQRLAESLSIADRAVLVASRELGLPEDWRALTTDDLNRGVTRSMTLTRFLLLALKGAGYLLLRMDQPAAALERLEKVAAFDTSNRLGVTELLSWARDATARDAAAAHGVSFIR